MRQNRRTSFISDLVTKKNFIGIVGNAKANEQSKKPIIRSSATILLGQKKYMQPISREKMNSADAADAAGPVVSSVCGMTSAGISCMATGDHRRAKAYFQRAVASLRGLVQGEHFRNFSGRRGNVIVHRVPITITTEDKAALSPDGSFEIFATAFSLSFRETGFFDSAIAVGAALYNMALNEHVAAISCGKMAAISRASELYALSDQMLSTIQRDSLTSDEALLLLARLNNEGHCTAALLDSTKIHWFQNHLLEMYEDVQHLLVDPDHTFFQFACIVGSSFPLVCVAPTA